MKLFLKSFLFFLLLIVVSISCGEKTSTTELPDPDVPFNPFDTVSYDDAMVPPIPVDSQSFIGLHTHIFSKSCNQPACHDGTFEPDFRTVQSAYNTLVYHPIKKNYLNDPLPYRVSPGDHNRSMIYKRLTEHNPPNFERMPSSGNPLPDHLITHIRNWIDEGAPDIFGKPATQSSVQPACYGLLAYNENGNRIDVIRNNQTFYPFRVMPSDGEITLWFLYRDVTPANDTIWGRELGYNKIKLSTNVLDFSDAIELDMELATNPLSIASAFSQPLGFEVPHYQHIVFNPMDYGFEVGDVVFIRTYVKDADHDITEIPQSTSQYAVQIYFAFLIQ